jgi:exonuclease SbcD
VRVALLGFPYERDAARHRFPALVEATGWRPGEDDVSLLCIHHCVEGATVGPADFTFRRGADVIRCRDIPPGVAAVLTGHVHRHQILTSDLDGRPLHAPVIYPGSVERTAFAEKGEPKGYVVLELEREGREDRWRVRADFRRLPTRPMVAVDVLASGLGAAALRRRVEAVLAAAPPDAVLRLRIVGRVTTDARDALAAATLRALAPDMNVDVVLADEPRRTRPRRARIDIPGRRTHEERAAHEPDLFGVVRPAFARRGRPPQRS